MWWKYCYLEYFWFGGVDVYLCNLLCLVGFGWGDKLKCVGLFDLWMLVLFGFLI